MSPKSPTPMSRKELRRRTRWEREGYGWSPQCYLCQAAPATTDDHVPLKGLFATSGGADAYLLPACEPCNKLLHNDETYFRDVLASSGLNSEAARAIEATMRGLQGSSTLYPRSNTHDLFKNLRMRDIRSPGGILLGREPSFDIDFDRVTRVTAKIVKGLFYRHFKAPMPEGVTIEGVGIAIPQDIRATEAVRSLIADLSGSPTLAKGRMKKVMTYVAWSFAEDQHASFWLLNFYQSITLVAFTESPRLRAYREAREDGYLVRPPDVEMDDRTD